MSRNWHTVSKAIQKLAAAQYAIKSEGMFPYEIHYSALFQQLTGRAREPDTPVEEFCAVVGRRGGKSRAISAFATFIAGLPRHRSRSRASL